MILILESCYGWRTIPFFYYYFLTVLHYSDVDVDEVTACAFLCGSYADVSFVHLPLNIHAAAL